MSMTWALNRDSAKKKEACHRFTTALHLDMKYETNGFSLFLAAAAAALFIGQGGLEGVTLSVTESG